MKLNNEMKLYNEMNSTRLYNETNSINSTKLYKETNSNTENINARERGDHTRSGGPCSYLLLQVTLVLALAAMRPWAPRARARGRRPLYSRVAISARNC